MNLATLLAGMTECPSLDVVGLTLDSRQIRPGVVFLAVAGSRQHGMEHAEQALQRGAAAIVYDPDHGGNELADAYRNRINLVSVNKLSERLGTIAARFFGDPSVKLATIGITDTNGKTSCSQFLAQVLENCAVIGTLGWGRWGQLQATANTTPDALAIQNMLAALIEQGLRTVVMEVSSHGLQQGRVNEVQFVGAVFTNLSRDHLDYHGSMADYLQAKLQLFRHPGLQFAVVNLDDEYADSVLQAIAPSVQCWTYSSRGAVREYAENLVACDVRYGLEGIDFAVHWRNRRYPATTPLVGHFNLDNVLAVLTTALALNRPIEQAIADLARLQPVSGRMERLGGQGKPTVFIDYAHTPDALQKVLSGLRELVQGQLQVIFGCGGNRDRGKRPQMGSIAERWADTVVLTDDNPRDETGESIINDILAGCRKQNITVINDREQAINTVIRQATQQDCIVIAGKGHENYQEVCGCKRPFSDRNIAEQALVSWVAPC